MSLLALHEKYGGKEQEEVHRKGSIKESTVEDGIKRYRKTLEELDV